jgi:hypothetical protein
MSSIMEQKDLSVGEKMSLNDDISKQKRPFHFISLKETMSFMMEVSFLYRISAFVAFGIRFEDALKFMLSDKEHQENFQDEFQKYNFVMNTPVFKSQYNAFVDKVSGIMMNEWIYSYDKFSKANLETLKFKIDNVFTEVFQVKKEFYPSFNHLF